ncbi:MAG: hypothetical protein AVDCRST_MAG47-1962 [uncultured Nocardioidaceae bacterium]|uniref:Uncharacterized protein n=1 Tax=uncultured Nocardioidaceae bacterium TaxID=253824 RepID=A0A6J4N9G1_9ACTN|nr:MAG: hypothetical protein AVDCRST_MAG47-1962 [uncultured Nocardioidaceae bacterium]
MSVRLRAVSVAAFLVALLLGAPAPTVAAEYETTPSAAQSWVPNGRVYDILTVGDTVYVGGTFTRVRNPVTGQWLNRERLVAFHRTTGVPTAWNPGANGTVRALAAGPDGVVYVGGLFTAAGGSANVNVAAIRPDGSSVPGFRSTPSGEVRDLLHTAAGLFVAGNYGRVDGVTRVGVAKVDAYTGRLDAMFNARLGYGNAFALGEAGGALVVGGTFKTVNGQPHQFLRTFDPMTGAMSAWTPPVVCDTCLILDLVVDSGRVYAAVGGPGGGRVAAWDLVSGQRLWVQHGDGDVQALDVADGRVYAGGHFGPGFAGVERHQLAVLDTEGKLLEITVPFVGTDAPGIWAVDAEADYLRLGGGFQGIEGSMAARYASFSAALTVPLP